jgi:hypothetical protein
MKRLSFFAALALAPWLSAVQGAPAPLPRAKVVKAPAPLTWADLAGPWRMTWSGEECPTFFYLDGWYSCLYRGQEWRGRWEVQGDTLKVEDGPAGCEPTLCWSARLRRAGPHLMHCGGDAPADFALHR